MTQVKTKDGVEYRSFGEAMDGAAEKTMQIVQGEAAVKAGEPADKAETVAPAAPDYEKMSRDELDKLAKDRGLDPTKASTKADVIALLTA